MSCGNLFLQDTIGRFWILSSGDDGALVTGLTTQVISNYSAPVLTSPSFYWSISVGIDGIIAATPVAPTTASASFPLSSPHGLAFNLTIGDDGVLLTSTNGVVNVLGFNIPYPTDVSMSFWPNIGLTSSIAGATPLTVSADFSIWSCTLNRFVNEDTTNIIVVLDE